MQTYDAQQTESTQQNVKTNIKMACLYFNGSGPQIFRMKS